MYLSDLDQNYLRSREYSIILKIKLLLYLLLLKIGKIDRGEFLLQQAYPFQYL